MEVEAQGSGQSVGAAGVRGRGGRGGGRGGKSRGGLGSPRGGRGGGGRGGGVSRGINKGGRGGRGKDGGGRGRGGAGSPQGVRGGRGGGGQGGKPVHKNREFETDELMKLAAENWAGKGKAFDATIVDKIYDNELKPSKYALNRITCLEYSQYLEKYLWPNFDAATASDAHVLSLCLMVNEKFREQVMSWEPFENRAEVFPELFSAVCKLHQKETASHAERTVIVLFLIHCFQSLENAMVRAVTLAQVALPLWQHLSFSRLELEMKQAPHLQKKWKTMLKKQNKDGVDKSKGLFLPLLLKGIVERIAATSVDGRLDSDLLKYMERVLELLIDLVAQLPTRRFFLALLIDRQVVVRCRMSTLAQRPEGRLFSQLLDLLKFYQDFEINEHTGVSLSRDEMLARHYGRLQLLQRHAFNLFPDSMKDFALANIGAIESRETLFAHLASMPKEHLVTLLQKVRVMPKEEVDPLWGDHSFVLEAATAYHERRISQLDAINAMPLYPTESLLWDENVVPSINYTGEQVLALPKLNLQYLTFHDYLLRNFNLFRLESTYEIRQDVEDVALRLRPRIDGGRTIFQGWSRASLPLIDFSVVEVAKPNLGETRPAHVLGEATYSLEGLRDHALRSEWDKFREHDLVFLLTFSAKYRVGEHPPHKEGRSADDFSLTYIRGAEVIGMLNEDGKIINPFDRDGQEKRMGGHVRRIRVKLDPAQYALDAAARNAKGGAAIEGAAGGGDSLYTTFNVIMKRKATENNFKAVLECIRQLMNADLQVPGWLHDVLLGYGDPKDTHFTALSPLKTVDFNDTLLDKQHVVEAFPGKTIDFKANDKGAVAPPFRLCFLDQDKISCESYLPPDPGPYPERQRKTNAVRFTDVQVGAILAGTNQGLTQVVGPPGTGKTDTAVQIISNIYNNFPNQRVLLVTHSNQALNDIFEKIAVLNIHERHLLRLGHDADKLETEEDFSKWGRVQFMLSKRLQLLGEVRRLAESLNIAGEVDYSCETAQHFYRFNVLARWEEYEAKVKRDKTSSSIMELFPFHAFFSNAPAPVFTGSMTVDEAWIAAEGCFRHLQYMFTFLDECRAFEILRTYQERSKYLVTTQAKIIAMTCTFAALKRHDLVAQGFEFDSLVMEESAQILEIETFIPMLLQQQHTGKESRLKRVVLIGDHNQLPPVIKNTAFQKYSKMDQSLFTRFVRLGVPYIELNAQGRARPQIAALYNWRYRALGDMSHVTQRPEFVAANAGFAHEFQLVDVADCSETEPTAYFYQNLAEAEYIVAVYMFMRLQGYPAEKISILSTYNGQVALLNDVARYRCSALPEIGMPHKISTVDKYQGQQNDYVLLSLVRTKTVGHVRDVRRLVVALSRSRLGLYVFGSKHLFSSCIELGPSFAQLNAKPNRLQLVLGEKRPTSRAAGSVPADAFEVHDVQHMQAVVMQCLGELSGASAVVASTTAGQDAMAETEDADGEPGTAGGET